MRKVKFVSVLVLLALLLSAGPGAVMGQEPPPDWSDPEAVGALVEELAAAGDDADELWAELPPEAQTAVVAYLKPARAEPFVESRTVSEGDIHPLGAGCKEYTLGIDQYSAGGVWLWRYTQKIWWCYDGSKITAKIRDRWGETHAYGWEFVGHVGNSESGGVGQSSYYAWTQGHFRLCLPGLGCIVHQYPWIWQRVYGNGNYEGDFGG